MSTRHLTVAMTTEQCWQRVPGGSATYIVELSRALADRDDTRVHAHHVLEAVHGHLSDGQNLIDGVLLGSSRSVVGRPYLRW